MCVHSLAHSLARVCLSEGYFSELNMSVSSNASLILWGFSVIGVHGVLIVNVCVIYQSWTCLVVAVGAVVPVCQGPKGEMPRPAVSSAGLCASRSYWKTPWEYATSRWATHTHLQIFPFIENNDCFVATQQTQTCFSQSKAMGGVIQQGFNKNLQSLRALESVLFVDWAYVNCSLFWRACCALETNNP